MYNYPEYAPEEEKDPYDELWEQIKGDICEEASIKKCDDTEIADWKEIQPRINYWGTQFSIASKADKVRAVDNICALVDKLTKKYDPGNPKKADEYEAAVSTLRKKYGRVDSAPVKYVGIIYPDNVFYLALTRARHLLHTIYTYSEEATHMTSPPSCLYMHSVGFTLTCSPPSYHPRYRWYWAASQLPDDHRACKSCHLSSRSQEE